MNGPLSLLKEFSKKISIIFIILFEQDCPKAVVHGLMEQQKYFIDVFFFHLSTHF